VDTPPAMTPSSPASSPIPISAIPIFAATDIDLDIVSYFSGNVPGDVPAVVGNETMVNVSNTTSTFRSVSPSYATGPLVANVTEASLGNITLTYNATTQVPADAQSLRGTAR
jgi:hypothetical protein